MIVVKQSERPAVAAVEFAVLLPFLAFLCVIATDWSRLFYYTITADACARNGALYASDTISASKSPYPDLRSATLAEAPELDKTATVTATPTTDTTGSPAVKVKVEIPFDTITNFPGVPKSQTLTRSVVMRMAPLVTR